MFEPQRLVQDCLEAMAQDPTHKSVREVVARAVDDPAAVMKGLGEPRGPGIERLYVSDELTVINVIWGPGMTIRPHNHEMWAVIGIYTGREDNIFWRTLPGDPAGKLEAAGAKALSVRDATPLGRDIIHSVTNPIPRLTGAIHVYGGDFFSVERSEWDAEHLTQRPYDVQATLRLFEEAHERFAARR